MDFNIFLAYNHKDVVKKLFNEYTNYLIESDTVFAQYLEIQNYSEEIENLEEKYGLPKGRLYLAYHNEKPVGCIALRKIDKDHCEMKRLYVKPDYRNKGLGKELVGRIIYDAKAIGYKYMVLDTLPVLESALNIYKKLGFYETEAYNDSPVENTLFLKLDLA